MMLRGAALLVLSLLGGVLPLRAERGPDPHPAPEPVLLELAKLGEKVDARLAALGVKQGGGNAAR